MAGEVVMEGGHRFGGDWTNRKLDVIAKYLKSYTTALKAQPFDKWYVDAFAGAGYREQEHFDSSEAKQGDALFADPSESEPQALMEGSARRALATQPSFDRYVFIERKPGWIAHLEELKTEFRSPSSHIEVIRGDANLAIQDLCADDWSSRRAVLFLDPYGMQVDWATIEAAARTRAIDLWVLFPLGMGVNRLLTRSGEIPTSWRRRLDLLLGTQDWYGEFYRTEPSPSLFGDEPERVVKAKMDTIGRYFIRRLASVFAGVAEKPAVLRNSRNSPLYLLCFAVGNERGSSLALRIANHLLKGLS